MQYEIRAMRVGEILDTGIKLTKNHFGTLFGIMAISIIPLTIITELLRVSLIGEPANMYGPAQPMGSPGAILGVSLLQLLNGFVIFPLANAAIIYAVSSFYLGKSVSIGEAFSHGLSRWGALIWTMILYMLAVFAGVFLLIIGAIIFAFWFALSQHVAVLEGQSGGAALSRSKFLMKGNMGAMIAISLLIGVILIGVSLVALVIPQIHAQVVVASLIQGVGIVFSTACFVVFYFSSRCMHENFDLQMLAAAVEEV